MKKIEKGKEKETKRKGNTKLLKKTGKKRRNKIKLIKKGETKERKEGR